MLVVIGGWMAPAFASGSRELTGPQMAAATQCQWPACAQVLSAVAHGAKMQNLPANLTPSLQTAAGSVQPPQGLSKCVVGQQVVTTPSPCVYNATATTKRMVLIGDSHADMWSQAVADLATANGYSLLFLAKIPCPLPLVSFWNGLNNTPNPQCTTWKNWAIGRIQQFDPSIVIATTEDYHPTSSNLAPMSQSKYSNGLVTTLKDFAAPGRRVVLLGDIPYLTKAGPICLSEHEGSIQSCSTPTDQAVSAQDQAAQRTAASKAGAEFINVIPWLCTTKSCPAVVTNTDVYSDCCHITPNYAVYLEPVLSEALKLPAS
ncbi:MAG TPA: SGNH hydrolase domain-containing protein [Isosphaeraceae bacterium]|nr:SGNH hydrolase domain-containing protein [Isosphaeraceae bacterium]